MTLIDSGRLNKHNLETCGITRGALYDFLKEQHAKMKSVLVMTVDGNGRVYFQRRGRPYKILEIEAAEKW